jgi:DNA-binding transcriptional ArsR family regulator
MFLIHYFTIMKLVYGMAAALRSQLGNITRLKIVRELVRAGDSGMPVGEIRNVLDIPNSTLSHHLSRLKSRWVADTPLDNDRIIGLLEVLMHCSSQLNGISTAHLHKAVLDAYHLTAEQYTRNQLAYDLRKLKAHGLIQRSDNQYVCVLSDCGRKAAAILVILPNRILRPIAGSIFHRPPKLSLKTNSKLQTQYRRTTKSFNDLITLLKVA